MLFIAENIKALRRGKGLTQEDVAEMLNVSPQSVSKWERGDTFPDITMLPALANLYKTSVDAIIGMDKINGEQAKRTVFAAEREYLRNRDYDAAAAVLSEALKTFPNEEDYMSELALALALSGSSEKLKQAAGLCLRILSDNGADEKVRHTTRAALCFIYLKGGEKEKAVMTAQNLPHVRESREVILGEINKGLSEDDIDVYLRFIALGENSGQEIIRVELGINMIPVCEELNLGEKVSALRNEVGIFSLPVVRIRDNSALSPNQVRVLYYADYLLDKDFTTHAAALDEIMKVLRKIAQG